MRVTKTHPAEKPDPGSSPSDGKSPFRIPGDHGSDLAPRPCQSRTILGMVAIAPNAEPLPKPMPRAQANRRPISDASRCAKSNEPTRLRRARQVGRVRLVTCSRDPIGYEGSKWNLFEYVASNPLHGTDPMGEDACDVCDAAQAACHILAGVECALGLATEAADCAFSPFPTLYFRCPGRKWPFGLIPIMPHPCAFFFPVPGSPPRIACCFGWEAFECGLKHWICYSAGVKCRKRYGCGKNPPPPTVPPAPVPGVA